MYMYVCALMMGGGGDFPALSDRQYLHQRNIQILSEKALKPLKLRKGRSKTKLTSSEAKMLLKIGLTTLSSQRNQ